MSRKLEQGRTRRWCDTRTLKEASAGLQYPSETNAPFEAFGWPQGEGKPDKARVLELAGLPPDTPVRVKTVDAFFKDATEEQDWMDQDERAEAQGFRQLVQTIKGALSDVKVFVVGQEAEKDAYIVGRAESGWAGLKTKVVET
jgi:hypothetical protein